MKGVEGILLEVPDITDNNIDFLWGLTVREPILNEVYCYYYYLQCSCLSKMNSRYIHA